RDTAAVHRPRAVHRVRRVCRRDAAHLAMQVHFAGRFARRTMGRSGLGTARAAGAARTRPHRRSRRRGRPDSEDDDMLTRRNFLWTTGAAAGLSVTRLSPRRARGGEAPAGPLPASIAALTSMRSRAKPITAE